MKDLRTIIPKMILILFVLFHFSANAQLTNESNEIEKSVDKYLTYFSGNNPGAVVSVMKKGEIIFIKPYGLSNISSKEKITSDQFFNLAELSKSITSVAVFKLIEKNKISLEESLKEIFPEFPDYTKEIKIKNLLNHTSGLPSYDESEILTNDQVFHFIKNQDKLKFEANSQWEYSNSDYPILVSIIEKVSNMSYQEFLKKNIFKKTGIDDVFFIEDSLNRNLAVSHSKINDAYKVKITESKIYGEQGIFMTAYDFAKWDKAFYSSKLLQCESLTSIFTVDKSFFGDKISYYAYGWVVMEKDGVKYYWHGGNKSGYTNFVMHFPESQLTVLLLTNRDDGYNFLKMSVHIAKLFDKDLKL